jgi:hypothetical protein
MRSEAWLFGGVAGFFFVTGTWYGLWSREPAGTAALAVSFLMASLISFFFARNHRQRGLRPEDVRTGEIADRAGPVDFFPPHSAYPVVTGAGAALTAVGVVHGLWLFIIGIGVLLGGMFGLVFQYVERV